VALAHILAADRDERRSPEVVLFGKH
jgi:hypothetical protein